ncbi:MAG: hypothetical protein ACKOWO_04160 [Sediminibacterium sp.]
MKHLKFILLCAVISAFGVSCTKSVYDEKQALEAQQGLLQFKYDQEIKLELLRQTGASALETAKQNLQYGFAIRTALFNDSLNRASNNYYNDIYYKKRDITVQVLDLVTDAPVVGAVVTIPTSKGTVITALTDSLGRAFFAPNENIPNPASALATKNGYASGSLIGTIGGTANLGAIVAVRVWNQATANNTVTGKVYVENDLTNNTVELAKSAYVNLFTFVNVKGYNQRFDWSTVTDANGVYSIKVPNVVNSLHVEHSSYEGTTKMYINGEVPGADSIPSIKSVPASFFLGAVNGITFTTGAFALTYVENADNSNYAIPSNVNRYHISVAADSNGRSHYQNAVSFSRITLTNNTKYDSTAFSTLNYVTNSLTSAAFYASNGTFTTKYSSVYPAGTTTKDTIDVKLNDVYDNADGYWIAKPILKAELTQATNVFGNKYKYISQIFQKEGGRIAKFDVNTSNPTTLFNRVKVVGTVFANDYKNRNLNVGFLEIAPNNINNGKTLVQDLTYGSGKLLTAVR